MASPEPSSAQLAAVRQAEVDALAGGAHERRLPVEEALAPLLPEGGIRRGTAVAVGGHGSITLAVALAAEASRRGSWVAAVGMADLGVAALAERGVDLDHWALVDLSERGRDRNIAADVLGAVVGGFDLVLVGPAIRVEGATARGLLARMREHGSSVICALESASADTAGLRPEVRLMIEQTRWTGIDNGHGRLLARQAEVAVGGRGAASRPRRIAMWLPSKDGRVAYADPTQISDFGFGRDFEDVRERRAG
ncbi:MAG: hypothetical protein F4Y05_03965 [Acidimicrobiaceae bacterium]|nr:hypothetical protein [Acidimicrobiaceae bacterium]MYE08742.1 hypothetical protein [Acidimicrobiaceae bacterium]MYI34922.1 hypothetical protein [Acidimicrobiaceae bacterium]